MKWNAPPLGCSSRTRSAQWHPEAATFFASPGCQHVRGISPGDNGPLEIEITLNTLERFGSISPKIFKSWTKYSRRLGLRGVQCLIFYVQFNNWHKTQYLPLFTHSVSKDCLLLWARPMVKCWRYHNERNEHVPSFEVLTDEGSDQPDLD